jgi:hypothetical protein
MEVGSKVRVPLTNTGDHRHVLKFCFALVTPITILPIQVCSQALAIKFSFLADAIHTVQMSRFVRASKYRQENLRIHLEAGN